MFDDADFDSDGNIGKKSKADKTFTLKDQIRKHTLNKMNNDESADSEDDAESDDDKKKKQRHAKESNLFTKIGVPQKDEEAQIKRDFKTQVSLPQTPLT